MGWPSDLVNPARGTVTVYSDIGCPWASLAVHRLRRAVHELGAEVAIDHRAFCLEIVNRRPTPKRVLDAEVPVVGGLDPSLGWRTWQGMDAEYPVTTLLALEAVQAAKSPEVGGYEASAALDAALRTAFYAENRCISILPVVLEVAEAVAEVDTGQLAKALDTGAGRYDVVSQTRAASANGSPVKGSPHLFTADGRSWHNPGLSMTWTGDGKGFPVIEADDQAVYRQIVEAATSAHESHRKG
jgi:predicted DsbA family dithiol-disulfide isomerase